MKELTGAVSEIEGVLRQFVLSCRLNVEFRIATYPGCVPEVSIEFAGPDSWQLTSGDGELLQAVRQLTAEIRASDRPELLSCGVAEGLVQ
ncbi:hypothetical protein [Granulicella tundricola]|uniref:Uncharacterized protein n=1 Tax=Granulicella tundricola (strain ATCC BAA-1859 / DSM 23138 / MP5ACTX9) TaxID=1198114 RepID=E8X6U8_GRATM|nr:hypothetical protein [Granulicella tundricola]ADW71248.1 hypothetical protein AciX9_3974 [Granulicella tundricola MP5ACTX9]